MTIQPYPLQWPDVRPRTPRPSPSPFGVSGPRALEHLQDQVRLLGGRNLVVSTNLPVGRFGQPKWDQRKPADPGVAAYFDLGGEAVCFACDKWDVVADNVRAIGRTIESFRGIDRWGVEDPIRIVIASFAALPAQVEPWHEVLGVPADASRDQVDAAYRRLAKQLHPDAGGTHEGFVRLQEAYQQAASAHLR